MRKNTLSALTIMQKCLGAAKHLVDLGGSFSCHSVSKDGDLPFPYSINL